MTQIFYETCSYVQAGYPVANGPYTVEVDVLRGAAGEKMYAGFAL